LAHVMIVDGIASGLRARSPGRVSRNGRRKRPGNVRQAGSVASISDTAVTLKGTKSSLLLAGIPHRKKGDFGAHDGQVLYPLAIG
jgi:hypothetical protein